MKRVWLIMIVLVMISLISILGATHLHRENQRLLQKLEYAHNANDEAANQGETESTANDLQISTEIFSHDVEDLSALTTDQIEELIAAIRERDAELERLRARFRPIQEARQATEDARDRRGWLERLQEEDPERHEQIVRRREDMRQQVNDTFARKAAHFLYRDTSGMDDIERQDYEHMLGLLAQTWQLAEQMQDVELERHERWAIGREVMANVRDLTPMLEAERDREFFDLALQLGYDESTAGEFVDYINDMIEVSTFQSIWRGMRGGWGRGGREE